MKKEDILLKLKKDYNQTVDKVDHPFLCNIRNFMMMVLIKGGIILDFTFPFFLSAFILVNSFSTVVCS